MSRRSHTHDAERRKPDPRASGTMAAARAAWPAEASTEQLIRSDRLAALGTLSAGVAHEINNPLTYVLVNLEHVTRQMRARIASGEPEDMEGLETHLVALEQALEGATRVRAIVRDLMTFAAGRVESKSMVDVRRVLEASLQLTAHELRHRARVERRLREVPPVFGNEARLGQVFLNLIVNAARAIPEGDEPNNTVTVATDVDEQGHVRVTVTDTGEGIRPDDLPHVFDPFFTTRPGAETAGLGLSIAHGIVASFGGNLSVQSVVGEGTRFTATFPVAPGYDTKAHVSGHFPAVQIRWRVLVLDDDPRVAGAISKSLEGEHDVEVATRAAEALDRLAHGSRYDVVICDLMMPDMTGMDFYRELLRVAPQLASHLIFMSGGVFTPRARAFVEGIPNRCIEKPPDAAKLRELVRRRGI